MIMKMYVSSALKNFIFLFLLKYISLYVQLVAYNEKIGNMTDRDIINEYLFNVPMGKFLTYRKKM